MAAINARKAGRRPPGPAPARFDVVLAQALLAEGELPIAEVARVLGISERTLRRRLPVLGIRGRVRAHKQFDVERAKRLLAQTNLSVDRICSVVGVCRATLYKHIPVVELRRRSAKAGMRRSGVRGRSPRARGAMSDDCVRR